MIKIRLTYSDKEEMKSTLETIKENFQILNISKEYKGRGDSPYSNIYIDVNNKKG